MHGRTVRRGRGRTDVRSAQLRRAGCAGPARGRRAGARAGGPRRRGRCPAARATGRSAPRPCCGAGPSAVAVADTDRPSSRYACRVFSSSPSRIGAEDRVRVGAHQGTDLVPGQQQAGDAELVRVLDRGHDLARAGQQRRVTRLGQRARDARDPLVRAPDPGIQAPAGRQREQCLSDAGEHPPRVLRRRLRGRGDPRGPAVPALDHRAVQVVRGERLAHPRGAQDHVAAGAPADVHARMPATQRPAGRDRALDHVAADVPPRPASSSPSRCALRRESRSAVRALCGEGRRARRARPPRAPRPWSPPRCSSPGRA